MRNILAFSRTKTKNVTGALNQTDENFPNANADITYIRYNSPPMPTSSPRIFSRLKPSKLKRVSLKPNRPSQTASLDDGRHQFYWTSLDENVQIAEDNNEDDGVYSMPKPHPFDRPKLTSAVWHHKQQTQPTCSQTPPTNRSVIYIDSEAGGESTYASSTLPKHMKLSPTNSSGVSMSPNEALSSDDDDDSTQRFENMASHRFSKPRISMNKRGGARTKNQTSVTLDRNATINQYKDIATSNSDCSVMQFPTSKVIKNGSNSSNSKYSPNSRSSSLKPRPSPRQFGRYAREDNKSDNPSLARKIEMAIRSKDNEITEIWKDSVKVEVIECEIDSLYGATLENKKKQKLPKSLTTSMQQETRYFGQQPLSSPAPFKRNNDTKLFNQKFSFPSMDKSPTQRHNFGISLKSQAKDSHVGEKNESSKIPTSNKSDELRSKCFEITVDDSNSNASKTTSVQLPKLIADENLPALPPGIANLSSHVNSGPTISEQSTIMRQKAKERLGRQIRQHRNEESQLQTPRLPPKVRGNTIESPPPRPPKPDFTDKNKETSLSDTDIKLISKVHTPNSFLLNPLLHPVNWTTKQVESWLYVHGLGHICDRLEEFDGALLLELIKIYCECCKTFYESVRQDLGLTLVDMLKLGLCLDKLSHRINVNNKNSLSRHT